MAKVELTAAQQAVIDSMKTDAVAYGAPSTVTVEKTADQAVRASTAARTLLIRQNGAVETDFGPGKPRSRPRRGSSKGKAKKASTGRTTAQKSSSRAKSASKSSKSASSGSKSKSASASKGRTGGK